MLEPRTTGTLSLKVLDDVYADNCRSLSVTVQPFDHYSRDQAPRT